MKHILAISVGLAIIFGFMAFKPANVTIEAPVGGGDGFTASACTVTHSVALVGHQESRTILSANSRRAWAVIQQPVSATNTVSLSLGGTATYGQGYHLYQALTASSTNEMEFGLNTDLPYTGAVTAITAAASSTVLVTQCVYNR